MRITKNCQCVRLKGCKIHFLPTGTCLSFPCEDSSMAVVGCENGCILKLSLHHTDTGPPGGSSLPCPPSVHSCSGE